MVWFFRKRLHCTCGNKESLVSRNLKPVTSTSVVLLAAESSLLSQRQLYAAGLLAALPFLGPGKPVVSPKLWFCSPGAPFSSSIVKS